jgi:hypothetical protein
MIGRKGGIRAQGEFGGGQGGEGAERRSRGTGKRRVTRTNSESVALNFFRAIPRIQCSPVFDSDFTSTILAPENGPLL